jgi:hypothetical protein
MNKTFIYFSYAVVLLNTYCLRAILQGQLIVDQVFLFLKIFETYCLYHSTLNLLV